MELKEQIQMQEGIENTLLLEQQPPLATRNKEQIVYERSLAKFQQFLDGLELNVKQTNLKADLVDYPFSFIKVRQEYLLESNYELIYQIYSENVNKYLQKHYQMIESCKKWKTWQTKFLIWLVVKYCRCFKKDVRYLVTSYQNLYLS